MSSVKREEPRKDSGSKRVNFDNESEKKFNENYQRRNRGKKSGGRKRGAKQSSPVPYNALDNAVRWYSGNEALMNQAGKMVYTTPVGVPAYPGNSMDPTIMAYAYDVTLGTQSVIPQVMSDMLSFVVHANSRNLSYDKVDLFMYVFAGKEVFRSIAELVRVYGVMRRYDGNNLQLPDALIMALGFEPNDLRTNYSHMVWDINNLIAQSRQFWVPNTMPVVEREIWMNSNIYMDSESIKDQMYAYVPQGYYKIEEVTDPQGTKLTYTPTLTKTWEQYLTATALGLRTWSSAIALVQSLIDSLANSQYRGVIMGDILKAYGSEKLYALNYIDDSYTTQIGYDAEVLTQMMNIITCPSAYPCDIISNAYDQLVYSAHTALSADLAVTSVNYIPSTLYLNFKHKADPSPAEVMVATRCMSAGMIPVNNNGKVSSWLPYTEGTERIVYKTIYGGQGLVWSSGKVLATQGYEQGNTWDVGFLSAEAAFDWRPSTYLYPKQSTYPTSATASTVVTPLTVVAEKENGCWINVADLRRLHTTAALSEWGVPHQK